MPTKPAGIFTAALAAAAALLPGCQSASPQAQPRTPVAVLSPTTAPAADDPVIAVVNGIDIHRHQLEEPLIESYGLTMLLNLVQLELAKQQVQRGGLHVTSQDVLDERDRTFAHMFADASKSDYEQLLEQFLNQQHLSRAEFDMVIETNANLRKLSEPQLAANLTEDRVHDAFNQMYGENRIVHDIELTNVLEAGEAKRRIASGKSFEQVAREMSLDRQTGALGGELPPFSAQAPNVPQPLKDAAFALQVGQISDPLAIGDTTHIIKLVSVIPPKIVKYDDVKDDVRKELSEQWIEFAIKEYRNQLAQVALRTMKIDDPVLQAQWKERLDQQNAKIHDRDSAIAELNRTRAQSATKPIPNTTDQRPPATMPGATPPGTPATRP